MSMPPDADHGTCSTATALVRDARVVVRDARVVVRDARVVCAIRRLVDGMDGTQQIILECSGALLTIGDVLDVIYKKYICCALPLSTIFYRH